MRLLHAAGLALVLTACTGGGPQPGADPEPVPEPDPEPVAQCEPVEQPPQQAGGHLIGDQEPPVPYSSLPPTSGWHTSGAFAVAVQPPDDPLTEAQQVSVLEAGAVVVTYAGLSDEDRTALERHVREHHDGRVAVSAYDRLEPGQVALTAWGTLQRCPGLDLAAVDAFVADHADPEPGVPGEH